MATNVGEVQLIATIDTSAYKRGARDIEKTNDDIEKSGAKSFRSFSSSASSSFDSVASSIAGFAKIAVAALVSGSVGIASFVKEASQLQSVRASFESLTGSIDTARNIISDLNKFSLNTAFSSSDINASARTLLGFGVNAENLLEIMNQIGDVAGATGGSLSSLSLVTGQVFAQGRLQAQDYYQIINSGAGSLAKELRNVVKEKTGLNDIKEAFEDGLVTAEMYAEALRRANSEGGFAFQGAIKQSKTFEGQVGNLVEGINNIGLEIIGVDRTTGDVKVGGVFDRISKAVQTATKWISDNKDQIVAVANVVIDNAIPAIAGLAAAFVTAKGAAIAFSIAASANPIGLIALAITALIGGLTYLQIRFNFVTESVKALNNAIRPAIDFFATYVLPILQKVGEIVWSIVKPSIDSMIESFKQLWISIQPLLPTIEIFAKAIGVTLVAQFVALVFVLGGLVSALSVVLTGIVNFVNAALSTFARFYSGIVDTFRTIGTVISQVLTGNIEGAINSVISWGVRQINSFIDLLNGVLAAVRKLPGMENISNIGKLAAPGVGSGAGIKKGSVPALAEGGIITSPTLALVGEGRESEAVIPLSKLDAMINGEGGKREYNIGEINIADQQTADYFLRKLTGNQEITSAGLVPTQRYA